MDDRFREMLIDAEEIRKKCKKTGDIGPHAGQMAKMIKYAQEKKLLTGNVLNRTASEELFQHAAEIAACVLEVIHGESIGSVLALSHGKKMEIILRAKNKAESDITAARRSGLS